ncbi:unnamed protein product, partial [Gadus morhua 'NCC']
LRSRPRSPGTVSPLGTVQERPGYNRVHPELKAGTSVDRERQRSLLRLVLVVLMTGPGRGARPGFGGQSPLTATAAAGRPKAPLSRSHKPRKLRLANDRGGSPVVGRNSTPTS